jgi:hypothetical protein
MRDTDTIRQWTQNLVTRYAERNRRYDENEYAYYGMYNKMQPFKSGPLGQGQDSKPNRRDNRIQVWNLQKPIVDTSIMQLSRLPQIMVPNPEAGVLASGAKADKHERILYGWWEKNNMTHKHGRMAYNLSVFGSSVEFVRPHEQFKMPWIQIRKPGTCYPMPKGEGEREFEFVIFRWLENKDTAERIMAPTGLPIKAAPGRSLEVEVIEYIDDTDYVVLIGEQVFRHKQHDLGYVPVCVTPALDTGEIFGPSDIDQLIGVNMYLNMLMTQLADSLEDTLFQGLFMQGGVEKPLNIGPGALNWIDKDTTPIRVQPSRIPPELFHQVQYVEEFMRTHAIWPRAMGGDIGGSNITGKAIVKMQGGATGMATLRQGYMGTDLAQINAWGMQMFEQLWPEEEYTYDMSTVSSQLSAPGKKKGTVTFIPSVDIAKYYRNQVRYSVFQGDYNAQVAAALQLQSAGILSKDTLRNELPGLDDASAEAEKIRQEKKEEMDFEIQLQQAYQQAQAQAQMQIQAQQAQLQQQAMAQQAGGQAPSPEQGQPAPEGAGSPPPQGGAPPQGAPGNVVGGMGGGGVVPGGPMVMGAGQPSAVGMGEPLGGKENFPLPFTEVRPYKQALQMMTGEATGGGPPGQGGAVPTKEVPGPKSITLEAVTDALSRIQKLKGEVYLYGTIVEQGYTDAMIEVALSDAIDKKTILDACPQWFGKFDFKKVEAGAPPTGAVLVAGAATGKKGVTGGKAKATAPTGQPGTSVRQQAPSVAGPAGQGA